MKLGDKFAATAAESLLEGAQRLMKEGDKAAATAAAIESSRIVAEAVRDRQSGASNAYDLIILLGHSSGVLAELGAYDAAIEAIQPIDAVNRSQHYIYIVQAATQNRDAAAIARMLPAVIEALEAPAAGPGAAEIHLHSLTRILALSGHQEEARKTYDELLRLLNASSTKNLAPALLPALKADLGDLPGALAAAKAAGDAVASPNAAIALGAALLLKNAAVPPTESEVEAAIERSKSMLPSRVAGPAAQALSAIAVDMAQKGDIPEALQAAGELDALPRDAVFAVRDSALSAIADAQLKGGDLRGSLSTVLKITQATVRWPFLLKLAAIPANQ